MSLIIRRLILFVVLKILSVRQSKILLKILLLLNCTAYSYLHRKHIECVKAE